MDRLKKTTRRIFGGANSQPLRTIHTPCRRATGNRTVTIKIFDDDELINDMAPEGDVRTELEAFLKGLATTTGIEAAVAAQFSTINFGVTYAKSEPSQAEIDQLDVNDFPIYLLTRTQPFESSTDEVIDLLNKHKIPRQTFVGRRQGNLTEPVLESVDPFKVIENDWKDAPTTLGFGIPGTYFIPNSQNRCRKIGIIKMRGVMTEHVPHPDRKAKFLAVLKHELGHMFGHTHQDNSIMDKSYDVNSTFTTYTTDQLWVMGRALTLLMQP